MCFKVKESALKPALVLSHLLIEICSLVSLILVLSFQYFGYIVCILISEGDQLCVVLHSQSFELVFTGGGQERL